MQKWRFPADNSAIRTVVGLKVGGSIRLRSRPGCGLFGPYVDLPAGICTARVWLDGPRAGSVEMEISAGGDRVLASRLFDLTEVAGDALELASEWDAPMAACEIRLHCQGGATADISAVEIDLQASAPEVLDPDRPVGYESRKTYADKIANGFFAKYLSGEAILEIGYRGYESGIVPIVPQAIGIDKDYPGYDGVKLPFADASQDAVYSSHCLEHIEEYREVLGDWYRVLKVGGYLIIVVPHHHLFERRRDMPSAWNADHKRFYTPASLLREVEGVSSPNTYRVRHLIDNDLGFDYSVTPPEPGVGCYEIELVIEKLKTPTWELEDGTSRSYTAAEFTTSLRRQNQWFLETDFSLTNTCIIWGPYVSLAVGDWEVKYSFEAIDADDGSLASEIVLDVGQNNDRIASLCLAGEAGRNVLRDGSATLRFKNSSPGALFEFRLHTTGKPFSGKLRFYGVQLDRLWPKEGMISPASRL